MSTPGVFWWKKQERVHEVLFNVVNYLMQKQTGRRERNIRCLRLYGNVELANAGFGVYGLGSGTALSSAASGLTLNIVESMCDTVTQKITKNKPKPMFLTSGGDPSMQKRAKLLNKFAEGMFYAVNQPRKSRALFKDATVFDTGFLHVFEDEGKPSVERVFPNELLWDEAEALFGAPRCHYRVKAIAREVLMAKFPKFAAQIKMAKRIDDQYTTHSNLSNMLLVAEGWHLPSRKGAKDGRHVMAIDNATLVDEDYERAYFPFIPFRWKNRLIGYSGQSLADVLTPLQYGINKTLRTIDLSLHLLGIPKVFIQTGSKIVKAHINNEVGGIIEYEGQEPSVKTFQVVPPQLIDHLERLYAKSYEIAGMSQLSAQAKKPAGLDSGKALREFNDIESERFITVGEDYEDVHLEVAKQMIDVAKEIHTRDGKYSVKVPDRKYGQKFLSTIDWKDVELEDDEYTMQCFPISAFSSQPSARLQDVQEWQQAGYLSKEQAAMLLDFPDTEAVTSLTTASTEDIQFTIEELTEGNYMDPEPFQNLVPAIPLVNSAYLRAKLNGLEEDKLELFRRWLEAAKAMMDKSKAPPPDPSAAAGAAPPLGQSPMAGMAPQAVPTAPPVSPMLPNAPGGMA